MTPEQASNHFRDLIARASEKYQRGGLSEKDADSRALEDALAMDIETLMRPTEHVESDELSRPGVAVGGQAFHDLRCYYVAMEAHLAASETDRVTYLERNIGRLSPTLREYIEEHRYNPRLDHVFPSLLRASVIVSLMSAFERYLNNICDDVRTIVRTPISHRDLRDRGTQRAEIS